MDIINSEFVQSKRAELMSSVKDIEGQLETVVDAALSVVDSWKFATDEYFTVIPYFHELNKFKKGRLIKNIQEDERLARPGIYSFGFNGEGSLVIMQNMIGDDLKYGVTTKIYRYLPNKQIDIISARYYPNKNFPNKLISSGRILNASNTEKIEIGVSGDGNWSVSIYNLKENDRVDHVNRYATGWNGATSYDFVYDGNDLKKIMVGKMEWWSAK